MILFNYRKTFGLSAYEMQQEPVDQFYTNLYISAQISKKQELESKQN